jgi:3-oxoacyl-[acyl-carrier-protein] synthase III
MAGNATYRLADTAVLAVTAVEAPVVVTSAQLDERLADTLRRVRLRPGLFERLAGIRERRWWPEGLTFVDTAVMAGSRALAESGIDPTEIGLLIDTSVSKARLEPSAAVSVHHALNLPTSCLNFDLSNACLGFVNAMQLAGTMIDAGQIRYALIVDGEGSRLTQERTLDRLTLALSQETWKDACTEFDWTDANMYVSHQISQVHTEALCRTLNLDPVRVPRSFPLFGNIGPASIPFTLAQQADTLRAGDRVVCMGIGSGLNASCAEVLW